MRLGKRHIPLLSRYLVTVFLGCTAVVSTEGQSKTMVSGFTSLTKATHSTPIKPLTVGDKVPDIAFKTLNFSSSSLKLSDLSGKYILLDFWATWCSSCISQFTKLNAIQQKFKDKLQVLLVNSSIDDNETKIRTFIKRWEAQNRETLTLPSAYDDTIARLYFKHSMIPHLAVIAPDGRIIAITSSKEITENSIKELIEGKKTEFTTKKEIDLATPLFLSSEIPITEVSHYSIFKKGYIGGLPSDRFRKSGETVYGRAFLNTGLLSIYKQTISSLFPQFNLTDKRIILEVEDSAKLILEMKMHKVPNWFKDNLFSYEMIVPLSEADSLYTYMLTDLNRYSNYYGRIEKRKVKCFILVRTSNIDKLKTTNRKISEPRKGIRYFKNESFYYFVNKLNKIVSITSPIIDETQYAGKIDIELPVQIEDAEVLRKTLQHYDLDLKEEYREMDMFILTEKKRTNKTDIY